MGKAKVFLTGGDDMGWALDEDLRLTRCALEGLVEFTDLGNSNVVHSVWWESILSIPQERLIGKRIVCHVPGEPFRYIALPKHRLAMQIVGLWITQTTQATRQFASIGVRSLQIPYTVDTNTFYPLRDDNNRIREVRQRWDIPEGKYLIGSFQRDTEGSDLRTPKLMKGPDIFVEIVYGLWRKRLPIHVVLAGPRRFWLRQRLADLGIPFTFVGHIVSSDDVSINTQPRSLLNVLYNLIDLYIVSSRSEGGPQSILEAAASGCKVISTDVGLAQDILEPECIYKSPVDALQVIESDLMEDSLRHTVHVHDERVRTRHRQDRVVPFFKSLYESIESVSTYQATNNSTSIICPRRSRFWDVPVLFRRIGSGRTTHQLVIAMWHRFVSPPWGGGNQLMIALKKALERKGVRVLLNQISNDVDAYLLQAIWFDIDRFRKKIVDCRVRVVHRVDGPVHLIRGADKELDDLCFDLNREVASATVIQSAWNLKGLVAAGYKPINPTIIYNAADPEVFNGKDRLSFSKARKIRLISTSWSDNPRKGGPIYKWIEDHLDWNRFEYTFVGNSSERFEQIRRILPVPSEQLANILRQHDIYITASQSDPCSNALIEALACGLPSLYLNDGGHPELVGYGGLPFNNVDEIMPQLDRLVDNYEMFQRLIVVPRMDDVAEKYLSLLRGDY